MYCDCCEIATLGCYNLIRELTWTTHNVNAEHWCPTLFSQDEVSTPGTEMFGLLPENDFFQQTICGTQVNFYKRGYMWYEFFTSNGNGQKMGQCFQLGGDIWQPPSDPCYTLEGGGCGYSWGPNSCKMYTAWPIFDCYYDEGITPYCSSPEPPPPSPPSLTPTIPDPVLNCNEWRYEGAPSADDLYTVWEDSTVCMANFAPFPTRLTLPIADNYEVTFLSAENPWFHPLRRCDEAFSAIFEQCVLGGNYYGGNYTITTETDQVIYVLRNSVYPDNPWRTGTSSEPQPSTPHEPTSTQEDPSTFEPTSNPQESSTQLTSTNESSSIEQAISSGESSDEPTSLTSATPSHPSETSFVETN